MRHAFCFYCETFVEVLQNKELACGHTVGDQQTMYEFLIDKVDKVLERVYAEHALEVKPVDRRRKAFDITMDFLGEWYSTHFHP